ncbi:MAG: hypothetical protein EP330_30150 [Deltaproteobacteria bacterium]|nr:MAG: hypothetical protein EP330_30150 [Deltaproteobacteria bacterium]
MRLALIALALASCAAPDTAPDELAAHGGELPIRRVGAEGAFQTGAWAEFAVVVPEGVDVADLHWQVSAGQLEVDGDHARWLLPEDPGKQRIEVHTEALGQVLSGNFAVGVGSTRAYTGAQQGEIATNANLVGDTCVLAFDGNTPHILYRNAEHGQLHLAVWNGATWVHSFVDGPGFNVGSTLSDRFDMVLDSNGDHHIAYAWADEQYIGFEYAVWWATDSGGGWTRELVSNYDGFATAWPSIALDPTNSERPTVTYTQDTSYDRTAVAYRTGANAWTQALYPENTSYQWHTGGSAFTSDGTLHITKGYDSPRYISWTQSGGFSSYTLMDYGDYTEMRSVLVLDDGENIVYGHRGGIGYEDSGGSWHHSEVELFDMDHFDLAWGGGAPHLAVVHDDALELVTTDTDGYWEYTVIATGVDAAYPGIAVDADGDPHACYQKGGALYYY